MVRRTYLTPGETCVQTLAKSRNPRSANALFATYGSDGLQTQGNLSAMPGPVHKRSLPMCKAKPSGVIDSGWRFNGSGR